MPERILRTVHNDMKFDEFRLVPKRRVEFRRTMRRHLRGIEKANQRPRTLGRDLIDGALLSNESNMCFGL
jgi:hypothetical protein